MHCKLYNIQQFTDISPLKTWLVIENPEYDNNNIIGTVKNNIVPSCINSCTSSCLSLFNIHAFIEPSNEYLKTTTHNTPNFLQKNLCTLD